MNDNGLRFKMNKTAKEREGLKLFGGLLPEFEINVPFINVDLKVAAPEVESIWDAIATEDDWQPFEKKVADIRALGQALA